MSLFSEYKIKCTPQRERILNVLKAQTHPVTAGELYAHIDNVSLATLYRTLELFCEKGIAKKHTIPDDSEKYYEFSAEGHRHFAVCLICRKMIKIDGCPLKDVVPEDFLVTDHRLEFYGYCRDCRQKLADMNRSAADEALTADKS